MTQLNDYPGFVVVIGVNSVNIVNVFSMKVHNQAKISIKNFNSVSCCGGSLEIVNSSGD